MKRFLLCCIIAAIGTVPAAANGVAVIDAVAGTYLKCVTSSVSVTVENQAAITTTTQLFQNNTGAVRRIKYAFPLPEEASATQLLWKINGVWSKAKIAATPQDTSLPGGTGGTRNPNLVSYLGKTPLYFDIGQDIPKDSIITVQLSYVELLKYENGNVSYVYPNDYHLIQTAAIAGEDFTFTLTSPNRTITAITLTSHTAISSSNSGSTAAVSYSAENKAADKNFTVQYALNLSQLGLFSLSTLLPDSQVPDKLSPGYFLFVAEPDPSANTKVISKVFTLIIDRSGSMGGTKIEQARNAATFIVNNLNAGDKFNIIDFDDIITSFRPSHVDFNSTNQAAALTYIAALTARNNTDIAGAFDVAIPQFSASATASTANIIIFFTDGQPTAGITTTNGILAEITSKVAALGKKLTIFTFGIGTDASQQLLSLIAQQNSGLAQFLGTDQLESSITAFYTKIRNPVLINTKVSFSPDIITEVYPVQLPSLYKGQQMVLVGRYSSAAPVKVTFSGDAFGQPVSYEYTVNLAAAAVDKNQFIPKVWAKKKIDNLLALYYAQSPSSAQAVELKNEITSMSMLYGVISPFTSFSGSVTAVNEKKTEGFSGRSMPQTSFCTVLMENGIAHLRFSVNRDLHQVVRIRIFNSAGRLVKTLNLVLAGSGAYEVAWDGFLENGIRAPNDMYFCVIDLGFTVMNAKMVFLR
jgi:Ca-activated chloride channel homolog